MGERFSNFGMHFGSFVRSTPRFLKIFFKLRNLNRLDDGPSSILILLNKIHKIALKCRNEKVAQRIMLPM